MSKRGSQGGQALLFVALSLPVLFGVLGVAVDVGYLLYMKRLAQTAADAAALAGAAVVSLETAHPGTVLANARAAATTNSFTSGVNGVVVSATTPPGDGPNAGKTNYVEAIVTQTEPTFFLHMLGLSGSNVAARAVAYATNGDCVFALNPSASGALNILVGAINVPNCAVIVDSSSSSALSGFLGFITARQIGIVGDDNGCFLCFYTPDPVTGITPEGDPLSYLQAPTVAACAGTAKNITSGTQTVDPSTGCFNVNIKGTANVTFKPGEYSAITITGAIAPTLTFQPGLYIIQGGGGLNLIGSGTTVNANGVTFYMGPSAGGVSVSGVLNFMNLVAPTTGTWAGILFFQDRSNTQAACIGGCGASLSGIFQFMQVQGALYFPAASLSFTGCCQSSSGPYYTAYEITVADKLSLFLDYFNDDYSSLPGGSPVKTFQLVE